MFGKIFDGFKKRVVNDVKNKAVAAFNAWLQEALAAAKSTDLDNDGVKDYKEVQDNMHILKEAFTESLKDLASIVPIFQSVFERWSKANPAIFELSKLAMLYYTRFGLKKPSVTLAALKDEQNNNVA
jgi:hypothetical protein